jgi:hypothetical protein
VLLLYCSSYQATRGKIRDRTPDYTEETYKICQKYVIGLQDLLREIDDSYMRSKIKERINKYEEKMEEYCLKQLEKQ